MSAAALLFEGRTTHRVKSWPDNFAAALSGRKPFEMRRDDRSPPYQCGDLVILQEWIPPDQVDGDRRQHAGYTGRQLTMLIGYVERGSVVAAGWCAFELIPTELALRVAAALLKQSL